jgi:hypothetical protein
MVRGFDSDAKSYDMPFVRGLVYSLHAAHLDWRTPESESCMHWSRVPWMKTGPEPELESATNAPTSAPRA